MKDNNLYDEFPLNNLPDDFDFSKYSSFKVIPDEFNEEQNYQVCRKCGFLYNEYTNDIRFFRICLRCRITSIIEKDKNVDFWDV